MAQALRTNNIQKLARALFAQVSAATGVRATGAVTVTANAGAPDKVLDANTYLLPVVGGQLRDDLLFKVSRNPSSSDGSWTVPSGTSASVAIKSNVGGARHNLAEDTVFQFDPPISDFAQTATLDATMTDGSDSGIIARSVAFFEDIDSSNPSQDIFAAKLGAYPALMLVWQDTEPAEGVTAGMRQGGTRGARKVRFMRETYVLYPIAGRLEMDHSRRQEGLMLMEACTRLLSDRQTNIDGEILSAVGAGVDINGRTRLRRGPKHYIYGIQLRVNTVLQPIDERTFNEWNTTVIQGSLPGREAPEPTEPIEVVDVTEEMP
jgi:hypothetical protein